MSCEYERTRMSAHSWSWNSEFTGPQIDRNSLWKFLAPKMLRNLIGFVVPSFVHIILRHGPSINKKSGPFPDFHPWYQKKQRRLTTWGTLDAEKSLKILPKRKKSKGKTDIPSYPIYVTSGFTVTTNPYSGSVLGFHQEGCEIRSLLWKKKVSAIMGGDVSTLQWVSKSQCQKTEDSFNLTLPMRMTGLHHPACYIILYYMNNYTSYYTLPYTYCIIIAWYNISQDLGKKQVGLSHPHWIS